MLTNRRRALLGALLVAVLIGLRVVHRGIYMPGWDFLGAAQGACLVHKGWRATWQWLVENHRSGVDATFWNVYGVPVALVPGFFAALHPWRYWPQLTTFLEGTATLLLLWRITRGPFWVLCWAVAGLGTTLSWLVAGYPYLSSWFPHVAALWVVLAGRSLLASLVVGLLALELPWHVQDLGHTVFVPFLAAAVGLAASWPRRLLWAALGAGALWLSVTAPTDSYQTLQHWHWPHWQPPPLWWPELPIVPLLGLIACLQLRAQRGFWAMVLGAQWCLAIGLLVYSLAPPGEFIGTLWPRRFLLTEFYTIAVLLVWARQDATEPRERGPFMPVALAAGAFLQLLVTVRWATRPLADWNGALVPLPYSETSLNYHVDRARTAAVMDWIARVKRGEHLDLDYGWAHEPEENWTDPQAALHQLYIAVGDHAFQTQVHLREPRPPIWGFGCLPDP